MKCHILWHFIWVFTHGSREKGDRGSVPPLGNHVQKVSIGISNCTPLGKHWTPLENVGPPGILEYYSLMIVFFEITIGPPLQNTLRIRKK